MAVNMSDIEDEEQAVEQEADDETEVKNVLDNDDEYVDRFLIGQGVF